MHRERGRGEFAQQLRISYLLILGSVSFISFIAFITFINYLPSMA